MKSNWFSNFLFTQFHAKGYNWVVCKPISFHVFHNYVCLYVDVQALTNLKLSSN